jgi:hypothetical protein
VTDTAGRRLRDLSRRDRWLFAVLAFAVAIPFAVAAFAADRDGWYPVGDDAVVLIASRQVFSAHPPVSGEATTSSKFGVSSHHPGPLVFEVYAPFVAVLGGTAGLLAGAAAVAIASIVLIGYVTLRQAGLPRAVGAWCATLGAAISFGGTAYLYDPFKSVVAVLPLFLFLFLCWALVAGDLRLLALWTAAGSFVAAASVQYLSFVGLLGLGTTVAVLLARRRSGRLLPGTTRGRTVLAASIAVGLVAWWGPLYDAAAHSGGNPLQIYRAIDAASDQTVGLRSAVLDMARALVADPTVTRAERSVSAHRQLLAGTAIGLLGLAAVALAWRRLRAVDRGLAVVAVGSVAAALLGAVARPATEGFGFVRLLALSVAAGFFWFATGSAVAALAAARGWSVPARAAVAPVGAVVVLSLLVALPGPVEDQREDAPWTYRAVPQLAAQLRPHLRDDGTWRVHPVGPRTVLITAEGVSGALEGAGLQTDQARPIGFGARLGRADRPAAGDVLVLPSFLDAPTDGWEAAARYEPPGRDQRAADESAAAIAAFARSSGATLEQVAVAALPVLLCPEVVVGGGQCPEASALAAGADTMARLPDWVIALLYVEQFDEQIPFVLMKTPTPDRSLLDQVRASWVDLPISILVRPAAPAAP